MKHIADRFVVVLRAFASPSLHDRAIAVEPTPDGVDREPAEVVVTLLLRDDPDSKVILGRPDRRDGLPALDEFPDCKTGRLGVRAGAGYCTKERP